MAEVVKKVDLGVCLFGHSRVRLLECLAFGLGLSSLPLLVGLSRVLGHILVLLKQLLVLPIVLVIDEVHQPLITRLVEQLLAPFLCLGDLLPVFDTAQTE